MPTWDLVDCVDRRRLGDSRYLYNARGYLERVREAREGTQGQICWTLTHQDARGNGRALISCHC